MAIDIPCEVLGTWSEFVRIASSEFSGKWIFRGVLDNWNLETSLERAAGDWKIPLKELPKLERRIIREFRRSFPTVNRAQEPDESDYLGWVALMQHHGSPTRLLDWTYSPFVAAYFVLEALLTCRDGERKAAIWAVSDGTLQRATELLPDDRREDFLKFAKTRDGDLFRSLFLDADPPITLVVPVNPHRLNERLVIQQGVFLSPGNISQPFEENLKVLIETSGGNGIRKLCIQRSNLDEAFDSLYRMNITQASLFPGLDGYARRLRTRLRFLAGVDVYELTRL